MTWRWWEITGLHISIGGNWMWEKPEHCYVKAVRPSDDVMDYLEKCDTDCLENIKAYIQYLIDGQSY